VGRREVEESSAVLLAALRQHHPGRDIDDIAPTLARRAQ
jgi:hypothetical protein